MNSVTPQFPKENEPICMLGTLTYSKKFISNCLIRQKKATFAEEPNANFANQTCATHLQTYSNNHRQVLTAILYMFWFAGQQIVTGCRLAGNINQLIRSSCLSQTCFSQGLAKKCRQFWTQDPTQDTRTGLSVPVQ